MAIVEGMHVFLDSYYSSVELDETLYGRKVYLTGTINRSRKGLTKTVKREKTEEM